MRVTKHWINTFFSDAFSQEEITKALFAVGIEIDEVIEMGEGLDAVVVARVESFEKHPDADKLSICVIDDGAEKHHLICGAKNFKQGDNVALAKIGAKLPNGLKIKKSKIRGVESSGMLCSEEELGLKDSSEGIVILPPELPLGMLVKEALALDDVVFELDLTPNRGDCFSVLGVAMEVAASTNISIKTLPSYKANDNNINTAFEVEDLALCPYYSLTQIDSVNIEESSLFIQTRLAHTGVRPIHNVVDITNYVLMERGQPLHAFDADRVRGKIVVRKAKQGEKLLCLDDVEYELTVDDLVIADESGPIAIAGVMGGVASSVTLQTKNILLESAWFDPQTVRNTSKRLNISTESSKRFEREIDGSSVLANGLLAAEMIQEHANGRIVGTQSQGKQGFDPRIVIVKEGALKRCLGIDIKNAHEYLIRLGFEVEKIDDGWKVMVPVRRPEIMREIDVIEEIARIFGYQNIPSSLPPMDISPTIESRFESRSQIRQVMNASGLHESYTYSFGSAQDHAFFEELAAGDPVHIENPIVADQTMMKTSMIANLMHVWKSNQSRQVAGAAFFECGKVYFEEGGLPSEEERCGILLSGLKTAKSWNQEDVRYGYHDIKGVFENVCQHFSLQPEYKVLPETTCFHPGQSAQVWVDGRQIGSMGVLHPGLLQAYNLQDDVLFAEISMGVLFDCVDRKKKFQEFSMYPHVKRDLAFLVQKDVTHQQVVTSIEAIQLPILHDCTIFDAYQGEGVSKGFKSLAYRFDFCSRSKTLKDKEVDKAIAKITKALETTLGAKLR